MALANLSIYYTWNLNIATVNLKFQLQKFQFNEIQGYFEYIIKKHETIADNPSVEIYVNKIKNRIFLKIQTGYKLELLTPETMKFLGSTKKDVDKDKDRENVPKLESVEVVLVHCNLVKNDYQHTSKVLITFVPNKQFDQLVNISRHSLTMMNIFNTEFFLLRFPLQIRSISHLKLRTMSIWHFILRLFHDANFSLKK